MQIAQVLSGYSLGEADLLRRAMGKKIKAEMDAQRDRFVKGALEKGLTKAKSDEIFDLLAKFADYGFNMYGNAILASSKMIAENPRAVAASASSGVRYPARTIFSRIREIVRVA